ncbi:hypothetical protein SKAU_G00076640 [Synaphobranchus kaupii]|uniref:Ig-like domain-containing protein n=1 Tax=Synaphobranchus kaupii TaxID=118154 RepID=A0A9Q1JA20_SYNKA|nr:hypothetical protein SKAU_G00076640 [Synaphobranchus kaupii]
MMGVPSFAVVLVITAALHPGMSQDGPMIIQSPAQPLAEGSSVTLRCLHWQQSANTTAFYRDGVEILSSNSTEMTIRNVTREDQGHYKCTDSNGTESPESWLSVQAVVPTMQQVSPTKLQLPSTLPTEAGVPTTQWISPTKLQLPSTLPSEAASPADSWLMVVVPCCILGLLLILALMLLALHHRSPLSSSPVGGSQREGPKGEGPQTKSDMTEIQWDIPWTETEAALLGRTQDEEQGI